MTEALGKFMRYRDRAVECRRLAEMMGSVAGEIELSNYYRRIAEHYIALAEAEETCARQRPRNSTTQIGSGHGRGSSQLRRPY